jgi:hypothetical protein
LFQKHMSMNVLRKQFLAKSPVNGFKINHQSMSELAHYFGDCVISKPREWYSFQDYVRIIVPDLVHHMKIAPLNELNHAFGQVSEDGLMAFPKLEEMSKFYKMVGWMLPEVQNEQITFHTFTEWFCKELDMVSHSQSKYHFSLSLSCDWFSRQTFDWLFFKFVRVCLFVCLFFIQRHYKQKYDEYNSNKENDMPKDTFQQVLRELSIKLTPMERNELFADNLVNLNEFTNTLKSRDIEFMELPQELSKLINFKNVSVSCFFPHNKHEMV